MNNIVFLNNQFLPQDEAKISVFDRGFLFGDGVYEVVPVLDGKMFDVAPFWQRFERSLTEVQLSLPYTREAFSKILQDLISQNALEEGGIYIQITRGVAPREFYFPKDVTPTCMAFCFEKQIINNPKTALGVEVVSVPDIRWKRRDIKSISLLAQCLAKEESKEKGGYEGWMVEDGFVTEGTASSAYIFKDGVIITRALTNAILPGIRRKVLLELATQNGLTVEQRAFSLEEAYSADEAFLSSATNLILPIVKIDGNFIGDGKVGKVFHKLRELYIQEIKKEIGA